MTKLVCGHCGGIFCIKELPKSTPEWVFERFNGFTLFSTCKAGQRCQKKRYGMTYDDIIKIVEQQGIIDHEQG